MIQLIAVLTKLIFLTIPALSFLKKKKKTSKNFLLRTTKWCLSFYHTEVSSIHYTFLISSTCIPRIILLLFLWVQPSQTAEAVMQVFLCMTAVKGDSGCVVCGFWGSCVHSAPITAEVRAQGVLPRGVRAWLSPFYAHVLGELTAELQWGRAVLSCHVLKKSEDCEPESLPQWPILPISVTQVLHER